MLASAARLFAEHGFRGVGINDIGAAAGVSGPALYRHFASKEAILERLLLDVSEQLLAGGSVRSVRAENPDDALSQLVDWQVEFALANPDLIVIQERDLACLSSEAGRSVRKVQRAYVEIWVKAVLERDGNVDVELARTAVHAAIGLINSTPHSVRQPADAETRALLARMALASLQAVGR
jgi:AcrR family transcriptional regulator